MIQSILGIIDRTKLLTDLQAVLRNLEADLLERSQSYDVPEVGETLRLNYQQAHTAERTAHSYEEWRSDTITQIASAWVLSCVFARFLEDNKLVEPPRIAGMGERLQRSRDERELYFRSHLTETDREYLLDVFNGLAKLPGARDIFGEHNSIRELPNWLSGDAAGELLKFFQRVDSETGKLVHDFTDDEWDTRFLGDLYQDLSEAAWKKYALLQTPEFVEEFILDRTLEPAIAEFGLVNLRMIDPACGSGHFLLGSFCRLLDRWQRQEPATNVRELVQRSLDSVHGVDVNPYAVAIARFRLLLAAMKASGIRRLVDAPAFRMNLVCGDSLLHGLGNQLLLGDWAPMAHYFHSEDAGELNRILVPGRYHAVVANPPYITPKDSALNAAYRNRYRTCYRQYSLAVPFMERIFSLAVYGGFTGQITANSFMKREFGKKLIENFIPTIDLTYVIDTSGSYIPGHGTPTVILFGRNRRPGASTILTVMGIRGEPSTPEDPVKGLVWSAVVNQVDQPGSQSEFVSVADSSREGFHRHPWSIGGGGAAELKEQLDESTNSQVGNISTEVGFVCITKADDVFSQSLHTFLRSKVERKYIRPFGIGEEVRDWSVSLGDWVIFPYDENIETVQLENIPLIERFMWLYRTDLYDRKVFGGKTYRAAGKPWYEYGQIPIERMKVPLSIAFSEVATHNHFVLDRGGKVFKQTAPVIKLPSSTTENDHLALLGLLNSSTVCFWLKQVCFPKKGFTDTKWEERIAFNATNVGDIPLPFDRPVELAQRLDELAQLLNSTLPGVMLNNSSHISTREALTECRNKWLNIRQQMIAFQEELDWQYYQLYDLIDENLNYDKEPPPIYLGQRAFEIVMARKMAAGELETTWFERHSSTPITELPNEWSEDYKKLVEQRMAVIETDPNIALIEQPEYKRRWNTEPWDSQLERALRNWLLDRLETYFNFDGRMNKEGKPTAKTDISLISVARLADIARQDPDFMQVGELYRNDSAFNVQNLVAELVESENVPLLPILRYKPPGLRKRSEWEDTWNLQRQEDAIDARTKLPKDDPNYIPELSVNSVKREEIGNIPVPPKYTSSDFQKNHYWRLRGKLDVPKERWLSFPHCGGDDGTLAIAWAGYNHLQLAQAISAYFVDVQERLGGRDDPRLQPLLACLIELLPWLKQWHNDIDPEYNLAMGDYFEGFIQEESRQMSKTIEEVRSWQPPQRVARRR